MKKIYLLFFLLGLFIFTNTYSTTISNSSINIVESNQQQDVLSTFKEALTSVFGAGQYVLDAIDTEDTEDGGKYVTATFSLFGEGDIELSGEYTSNKRVKSLEVEFPEESTVDFNKINQLVEGKLSSYLPEGFPVDAGIWIKNLSVEFGATGYIPSIMSMKLGTPSSWNLIDEGSFSASNVEVEAEISDPNLPSSSITGTVSGTLQMGDIPLTLSTSLSNNSKNNAIKAKLESINLKNILEVVIGNESNAFLNETPDLFKALELSTVELAVFPGQKAINFKGNSSLGNIILDVNRGVGSEKTLLALRPPSDFKFSDFAAILAPMDNFDMSGSYFIVTDKQTQISANFLDSEADEDIVFDVKKGVNLVTSIALPQQLEDMIGLSSIELVGSMPLDFTGVNLYAKLGIGLEIGDAFTFKELGAGLLLDKREIKLRLEGAGVFKTGDDEVEVFGGLILSALDQSLEFEVGLAAGGRRAEKPESCLIPQSEWSDPFGIEGVGIRSLGIRGGVMVAFPWIATIGLDGNVRFGSVKDQSKHVCGAVTAYINIADVSESMLVAEVQNLTPLSFIEAYSEGTEITGSLRDALDTGIESAKLKVVPREVELFGRTYSPGIALDSAKLTLAGIDGLIGFSVGESGIKAYGQMDPYILEEGGVTFFAIKGTKLNADGSIAGPSVSLGLDAVDPHFRLDGSITVLEMTAETFIEVNKDGFEFEVTGNVLDGALKATAHIKAGELTPNSGLYAKVAFENRLQTMVADELINYIKTESEEAQKAYNDAQKVLEAEKSGNEVGDAFIDLASGAVDAFAEMDKGLAVAGTYVVKGLLKDALNVRKISFEGEVTSMKAKVEVEIDMTIAGSDITEKVSMELNISEDMFVDLIVDAIGDEVIDFFGSLDNEIANGFEDLGEELETAFEDLGGYIVEGAEIVGETFEEAAIVVGSSFEDLGDGIVEAAEYIGEAFEDFGRELEIAFVGDSYAPSTSSGGGINIPYNHTLVTVTVDRIVVTDDEGDLWDDDLELYGNIIVNVSSNLRTNAGATPFTYGRSMQNSQSVAEGKSATVGHSKYFYVPNHDIDAGNGWIQLVSKVLEYNSNIDYDYLNGSQSVYLSSLGAGQVSKSFTAGETRGNDEEVRIEYRVTVGERRGSPPPPPSKEQMIAAVLSGNLNEVNYLVNKGGNLKIEGIIDQAITNNLHQEVVKRLMVGENLAKSKHLTLATNPSYRNSGIIKLLLNNGVRPNSDALLNEIAWSGEDNLTALLIQNHAVPQLKHVQKAISIDNIDRIYLLMNRSNVQVGANELQYAIQKNDLNLVKLFIERGANVTPAMITKSIEMNNIQLIDILLNEGQADHSALQAAANNNNASLFKTLTVNRVRLSNNGPINTAIDNNNLEIVKLGLNHGGSKNETLNYAVSKKNKPAMILALERGANGTSALDYAVNYNDVNFFNDLIFLYNANSNQGLSKAYTKGNIDMGRLALSAGAKASNQIAAAATAGQKDWVKLLLEYNGDPKLGMSGAVTNQHIGIVEMLIDKGADAKESSLIISAASNKNFNLVKLLVNKGNAIAENARPIAIKNNDVHLLTFLLDNNAKATGLSLPASNGWFEMVKLLVDRGADANEGIANSINNNHTNISVLLLDNGADVKDYIKTTARLGNEVVTKKLLEKGANPNDGTFNSVKYKQVNVLRILIDAGADASKPSLMDGAVIHFHEEMIVLLLENGGDIEFVLKNGNTYLHRVATKKGKDNLVKIFIDAGIDIDARNKDGQTPLHLAVRSGKANVESVRALVDAGADVNAKTNKGKSVFQRTNNKAAKEIIEAAGGVK